MKKRKIYVASSWRNKYQEFVVKHLRLIGHEVYDFKNPSLNDNGFAWSDIDPDWENWTNEQYVEALNSNPAIEGYANDYNAMLWANTFVGVMPFGRSASMEMGWAAGRYPVKVKTILYFPSSKPAEPELMVKMFDHICFDIKSVTDILSPDYAGKINLDLIDANGGHPL